MKIAMLRPPLSVFSTAVLAVLVREPSVRAQAAPVFPTAPIRTIPHPNLDTGSQAYFGYHFAIGDVELPVASPLDDLVVSAIQETYTPAGAFSDVVQLGAGYSFVGEDLHGFFTGENRLSPLPPLNTGMQTGYLGVAIGRPITASAGGSAANRVFLGASFRDFVSGSTVVSDVGSVEMFDLPTSQLPLLSITPPPDPGDSAPKTFQHFGFEIALGDITGDGIPEMAVGAPEADSKKGRVYVFMGGGSGSAAFPNTWIALLPPAVRGSFGGSIVIEDLNGDGYGELVVGAYQRDGGIGRVEIFDGSYVSGLPTNGAPIQATSAQTIFNPQPLDEGGWFGFRIFEVGDLGSSDGTLDGRGDIAIHSEGADDPAGSGLENVGGLFVYFRYRPGESPLPNAPFLNPTPVALLAPANVGGPQENERFGRAAAGIDWLDVNGVLKHWLVAGGPDAEVIDPATGGMRPHAGRVVIYRAPLSVTGHNLNAWPQALLDPTPVRDDLYGCWLTAARYTDDYAGQQLIVGCRAKDLTGAGNAGQVYAYGAQVGP